jgi:hypothetical protein
MTIIVTQHPRYLLDVSEHTCGTHTYLGCLKLVYACFRNQESGKVMEKGPLGVCTAAVLGVCANI